MKNQIEENVNNNEDSDNTNNKNNEINTLKIKVKKNTTINNMTKISELELIWNKILGFSKDKTKKEMLIKYCDKLSQYIRNELKENKIESKSNNNIVLNFFKNNIILEKITNFIITCPDNREIFILYSSYFLNLLKFKQEIIKDNLILKKTIFQTIINLFEELKKYKFKFKLKNEFSIFLNGVTRLLLNYPKLIPFFRVRKENLFTHYQYDDYFIFSSLLIMLEIDDTIQDFEYKKYIRRSLIVYLSFDEIINSYYFQKKINFVEILINKLCNYYQMLPEFFEFEKTTGTFEIGCNMHFNFQALCPKYFDYVDYISFLNKITNCLSGNIKKTFKYYFFNKFCVNNIQPLILSSNIKISRTHFQYIITLLYFAKSDLIVDTLINFLFGFRESYIERKFNISNTNDNKKDIKNNNIKNNNIKNKNKQNKIKIENDVNEFISMTEDYIYNKHKDNDIFYLIMNYLTQTKEYINVIIYELFEILFQIRPYLMIKKFIKPYTDFVIKQSIINKIKYKNIKSLNKYKSYPITIQLIKLINFYKQFDSKDMLHNFQSSAYKNFAFYINYDIDFYLNYLNKKKEEEEDEKNNFSTISSFTSYNTNNNYNTNNSFYSSIGDFNLINQLSVDNLMDGLFDEEFFNKYQSKEKIEHEFIFLDKNIFNDDIAIDEGIQNMNFLFMKNIYEKLLDFFKNNIIENIFLTNLLLTIISVPCLNFDKDLVQCNAIILDDNYDSKYSFLTLFRFLCQEILNKFKSVTNIDKLKTFINFVINSDKNDKNNFTFKGFLKMKYNEKNKDKIEVLNFIVFCEFIKEYISSVSYKHKFEGLIENLYEFYVEELEKSDKSSI